MWFYMNVKGLEEFNSIYEEYVNSLSGKDNKYKKLLTEGWPNSEWFEYTNISDKRQFSNLILSVASIKLINMPIAVIQAKSITGF